MRRSTFAWMVISITFTIAYIAGWDVPPMLRGVALCAHWIVVVRFLTDFVNGSIACWKPGGILDQKDAADAR